MSCPHNPQHDAWLQAVVEGEVGADRYLPELESCPTCSVRLAELLEMTDVLDAIGDEQRQIMTGPVESLPGDAELVSRGLEIGLEKLHGRPAERKPAPERRHRSPWPWVLAAAALLGIVVGTSMFFERPQPSDGPKDQIMNQGEAWPTGKGITTGELLARGFAWAGHPEETFQLLLFRPSDPLDPWHTLECTGPMLRPDRELVDNMRRASDVWNWQYERTSPAMPDSPSVAVGELVQFAFVP